MVRSPDVRTYPPTQEPALTGPDREPLGYVIVICHPGVPLSLTDESLWALEECVRDVPQVEADMPGAEAIVCEVRPVRRDQLPPAAEQDLPGARTMGVRSPSGMPLSACAK